VRASGLKLSLINLFRALRLVFLRLHLLVTSPSKRFRKFGVAAATEPGRVRQISVDVARDVAEKGSDNAWVVCLDNGLVTSRGEVVDRDGRFLPSCSFNFIDREGDDFEHEVLRVGWDKLNPIIREFDEPVVSLAMNFAYQRNYFHWLFDALPRLHLARLVGFNRLRIYTPSERAFQADSLVALGVSLDDIIPIQETPFLRANELIVPSVPNAFRSIPEWVTQYLRTELMPTLLNKNGSSLTPKLFISRSDATHRRALNEMKLQQLLEASGFATIVPSSMSLQEQVNVFSNAQVVVAIHSAALANLVFCNEGVRVLEITPPNFEWELFGELARQCRLDYRRCKASAIKGGVANRFDYQKQDFSLDFEHLAECLRWVCE